MIRRQGADGRLPPQGAKHPINLILNAGRRGRAILRIERRYQDSVAAPLSQRQQAADTGRGDGQSRERHVMEGLPAARSEEHTSELQSLMRISYAVFCLKKKKHKYTQIYTKTNIDIL